jgi:ATP-dependent DNA helicase DinG
MASDPPAGRGTPLRAAEALGRVTSALPGGGEARPGQVAMAEAVEEALVEHRHLIVQAGTGTGKSLAYLVPAAQLGRTVVVATATKSLQEQLATRDAPLVAEALDGVVVAVLKGRSNYLCRQKTAEMADGGIQAPLDLDGKPTVGRDGGLVAQVRSLMEWESRTATGDMAELGTDISPQAWSMVSVGTNDCPGATKCPQGHRCFTEMARAAAREADIVVTNLHLLGAHLASDGQVLPDHDAVIIDEAHALEEVMTQCLGIELGAGRIRALANEVKGLGIESLASPAADLAATADGLADVLEGMSESEQIDLEQAGDLAIVLRQIDVAARKVLGSIQGLEEDADAAAIRAVSSATRLVEDVSRLSSPATGEVLWPGGTRRSRTLTLSPLAVGPALEATLFSQSSVILTSATIPLGLGARLGLDPSEATVLDVGSPFDFRSQSLLYVPEGIGDRRSEGAEERIADEIASLIDAAGGRTLALFTSYRAMNAISDMVANQIAHPILIQGQASVDALIEQFRVAEDACLFATLGMWQGLDVPGRSLSLVTIDRLPFGRPDDPLLEARREAAGDQAFMSVDVPRATTLLAQGVGRLIRTASDSGVVAVMDDRLATKRYRTVMLDALPPMKRTRTKDEVLAFLERIRDSA